MSLVKIAFSIGIAVAMGFGASGCHTHHHQHVVKSHPGGGPPPHAPAHGYRKKHAHGTEIVYDAGLGVYVVVGIPDLYFSNDIYYRYYDGFWQTSVHADGPWRQCRDSAVPTKLRGKHGKASGHPGRGNGKGRGKRKG